MKSLTFASALFLAGLASPGADWLTDGGDPQRNNWQKDEKLLSVATAKDIKLLWKIQFDNQTRAMHNLLPPLVIGSVNTPSGPTIIACAGVLYFASLLFAPGGWLPRVRASSHRVG